MTLSHSLATYCWPNSPLRYIFFSASRARSITG